LLPSAWILAFSGGEMGSSPFVPGDTDTVEGPIKRGGADERRRFVAAVVARKMLEELAGALAGRGIPIMPLKGVLFQLVLYADPSERAVSDVDVLVPERHFAVAIETAIALGCRPLSAGPSWIEATFMTPCGLPLDLHQRLFCSRRYHMPTDDVFHRASVASGLIGAPIWLPHPLDIFAHLIGKFVSDHVHAEARARLRELELVATHYRLEPVPVAKHLIECGLGRAARHVLSRATTELEHPFFGAVLSALPDDPVGLLLARIAAAGTERPARSLLAPICAHMLNTSLPRAATSLALALGYAARHAHARLTKGALDGHWAPFFATSSNSALRKASSARRS
jgi:hypothetical protein